jgi:pimeloyl-ACP methyl ester carboxylesterase
MRIDVELAIAVLNGAIGDYLKRTDNGLATDMVLLRRTGADGRVRPVEVETGAIEHALREGSGHLVISVHGLMSTESVWELPDGTTYGSLLELDQGVTALDVRYNTGLHISENGESLDALLSALLRAYPKPIERIDLIGHSMGGLVIRSATHFAALKDSPWLGIARRAFYVGSPHLGAPLERFGNVLTWTLKKIGKTAREPITELIGEIIALRSNGVKDLRYGNLRHEDWTGIDADALLVNRKHPVPLLPSIRHHLVAATLTDDPWIAMLFGDALVPLKSATGRATPADRVLPLSDAHVRIFPGMHHLQIAHDRDVFEQIRSWYEEA